MNFTAGTTLQKGRYILHETLSRTGSATTFKATQTLLNKPVVVKTIRPASQVPVDFGLRKEQFTEQVRRLSQSTHPGLVSVLDLFEESGLPIAIFDYIAGQSLGDRVQLHGSLPEAKALKYIRQVGSALTRLHQQGGAQGDVQPNKLIRPTGADVVVLVGAGWAGSEMSNPYTAPELSRSPGTAPTPAADVYGLAASLYFLLTGQAPIAAALRDRIPLILPRQIQPQISAAVETAIVSGMEMIPVGRPQTIAEWLTQLSGRSGNEPTTLPVLSAPASNGSASGSPTPHRATNGANHGAPPSTTGATNSSTTTSSQATLANGASSTRSGTPALLSPPTSLPSQSINMTRPLVLTSVATAVLGLGLGLALRLNGATGPGSSFFHTEQAFPPAGDFPLTSKTMSAPDVATPATRSTVREEVLDPEPIVPRRWQAPPPVSEPSAPAPVVTPARTPAPAPVAPVPAPAIEPVAPPDSPPIPSPEPPPVVSPVPESLPPASAPKEETTSPPSG